MRLRIKHIFERPMLIDMWAEWCTACKEMDAKTFSDDKVIAILREKKWVLLKLDLTKANEKTKKIQEKYKLSGLPSLVLIRIF